MRKHSKFISCFFIITIFIFLFGYVYEYKVDKTERNILNNELKGLQEEGYQVGKYTWIDFSKEYPFAAKTSSKTKDSSFINKLSTSLNKIINKIDDLSNDLILGKDQWIYLYGKIQRILGDNIIFQETIVYKNENDYLTYINDPIDTSKNAANLNDLHDYVVKDGTTFMYVQLPYKLEDDELNGIDYSNDNASSLLEKLAFEEVLDLRDTFVPRTSYFYKTDHHFNAQAGLLTARSILEALEVESAIDNLNEDKFISKVYEDSFLGSQGKKMGRGYSEVEDFEILYPSYATSFQVLIPDQSIEVEDSFEKALFNIYPLVYRKDFYGSTNIYATFMYGNPALARIKNTKVQNDTKLLLIHDSFSAVVAPYMALGVSELDAIDLRYFNGSLENFIQQNDYDAIVVAYNPSAIVEASDATNNFFYFK